MTNGRKSGKIGLLHKLHIFSSIRENTLVKSVFSLFSYRIGESLCSNIRGEHFFGAFLRGRTFCFFGGRSVETYRVSFIGHRQIYETRQLEDAIEKIACGLILQKDYVEFYLGRNGDFDISAASAVKRAQRKSGMKNSSLILVLPYHSKHEEFYEKFYDEICMPIDKKTHFKRAITKRNEWIVDNSDLLIAYVESEGGGAYRTLKYAEQAGIEIINLPTVDGNPRFTY